MPSRPERVTIHRIPRKMAGIGLVVADAEAGIGREQGDQGAGEPPVEPEPEAPETATVTGVLLACDAGLCLDVVPLDVGTPEHQAATALADHDQDGVLETNGEELAGLVGATVELTAAGAVEPFFVLAVAGRPYREDPAPPASDETLEPAPEPAEPVESP